MRPDYRHLPPYPTKVIGDLLDAADGGGKTDALELAALLHHPLERDRELRSPLVLGKLVDLVDHHEPDVLQMLPEPLA